ncbi:hypothetical protein COC69_05885 [Bacillus cereus]|uniref:Uncharacterized protein n=1 Tax=Bacillus cereus TaxID=1396 RepID=A0A9X7CRF3_BACCE|nr:hypothetical protein [Bacillus cereus]PGS81659.1 hypothetical protein COC69_05885 [Bacillus cereus]
MFFTKNKEIEHLRAEIDYLEKSLLNCENSRLAWVRHAENLELENITLKNEVARLKMKGA